MTPVRRVRVRYPSEREDETRGWDAPRDPVPALVLLPRRPPEAAVPEAPEASVATEFPATSGDEPVVTTAATEPAVSTASQDTYPVAASHAAVAAAEAPAADVAGETVAVPRTRRRQRLMAWAFGLLLPVAAFATGVLLFNSLVMPKLIHGGGDVEVPDLTHLTIDQAEQALTPLNLQLSRAGERFDPAVPRGFVLSQDPGPGIQVRGRRRVSVVLSLGEEFSSVPELRGESERGAFALLASAGLRAGGITRAPSEDVGEGLVVTTDPPGASVLPHDQPVGLLISAGSGPETFVMPDLIGWQVVGARRQLEAFGFRVLIPPAAPAMGSIVSQSPAPGSRITRTTTITIQASGRMIR